MRARREHRPPASAIPPSFALAFTAPAALASLSRALAGGRLAHAYLITGPHESIRREVAAGLAAMTLKAPAATGEFPQHSDLRLVEPESKSRRIGIEQVRTLCNDLSLRSMTVDGRKVGVIIDAERLTTPASNAFLKTLEEPPPLSLLLLVTARPEALLDTILSRCLRIELHDGGAVTPPTPREARLAELLRAFAAAPAGKSRIAPAYGLLRDVQVLLSEAKAQIKSEEEDEFSAAEDKYERRDYGAWLDEKEDYHKTQVETRYLAERDRLIGALARWWGDRLRASFGTGSDAEAAVILRRLAALEQLHEHLARNVQEALALEAAFLEAFGG